MPNDFPSVVLHVNPQSVVFHTLEPHLKWVVWSAINLPSYLHEQGVLRLKYLLSRKGVFGGSWDLAMRPFSEREEYRLLEDLNSCIPDFRRSLWYLRGLAEIRSGQPFRHKDKRAKSQDQLDGLFAEYLVPLLESMRTEGYRQRAGVDFPEGMIGRDGTLIKTAHGTHRLASAKISGATGPFPIKIIGVHRQWLSGLERQPGEAQEMTIERELRRIEHRYQ